MATKRFDGPIVTYYKTKKAFEKTIYFSLFFKIYLYTYLTPFSQVFPSKIIF